MTQGNNWYSPARVIFGIAAFVACVAFFANTSGVELMNTSTMLFVVFGALTCCLVACSTSVWRNGIGCFIGNNDCNTVEASAFWNCFGNYAWMTSILAACMTALPIVNGSSSTSTLAPMFYTIASCICYGVIFRAICTSIACAVNNCNVVGNVTTTNSSTTSTSSSYSSANVHESVNV